MKATVLPVSEAQECFYLVDYLNILTAQGKVVMFTHIPNSTFTKSWAVKVRNKKMGVAKGFPDYFIVTPGKALAIEMKTEKNGYPTAEQKMWIEALNKAGVHAYICRGFEAARKVIEEHL